MRAMLGRFLGLAAVIAAVSIGMAAIASRTADTSGAESSGVSDGWNDRGGGGWSSASASRPSGEVQLTRASDSHFYADAEVDGANIRMMVDSGASVVALTRRDAEAIGIDVDRLPISGSARTAGGEVPVRQVMLESVEVDGVEVRRVRAAVVDSDMGISLLGQTYLSRLNAVAVEGDVMTLR